MTKKRRAPAPDEAPIVTITLVFVLDDGADDGGGDDDAAGVAGSDEMELSATEVVVGMSVVPPLKATSLDVELETILKWLGHRGYM